MNRREFLVTTAGIVAVFPLDAFLASCSNSNSNGNAPDGGASSPVRAAAAGHPASGAACADPLPESQLPDTTMHVHTVTIPASMLSATADQTLDTSVNSGHMHAITLTVAQLEMIKAGTAVTVVSTNQAQHTHSYKISCTA